MPNTPAVASDQNAAAGPRQAPPVNIYEGNGELSVALPLPGAHPAEVRVVVHPDQVEVSARSKYSQEAQHYHRRDWHVGTWEVTVPLPRRVTPDRARATLHLGVLVVMAPIGEGAEGAHQVPVR